MTDDSATTMPESFEPTSSRSPAGSPGYVGHRPRRRADVTRARPDKAPGARFCSRMCADQPATRAHANIARGRAVAGSPRCRGRRGSPVLDVRLEHTVGRLRTERSQRGLLESQRDLDPGRPELLRSAAKHPRARILACAIHAVAEAHDANAAREHLVDVLRRVTCLRDGVEHRQDVRGGGAVQPPGSVPTADDIAAAQSAPVDAATRAVKVEAFSPCSAVQIQYVSRAFTARGSASPRQRIKKTAPQRSRPCRSPRRRPGPACRAAA